jgi:serine phosphatase RsbU (regulator of sigma subunit)/anti-sigma regulatory factor (Ser/Thr protein kinase)
MNGTQKMLLRQYVGALHKHLLTPNETALHDAYEIGRKALHNGLGVLDIAALYHDSLHETLASDASPQSIAQIDRSVDFFAETLSPFEMMLRGYRENNTRLTEINKTLLETKSTLESILRAYESAERVSTRFQEAALPQTMPHITGFRFDTYYRPAPNDTAVGGDWYDAMRLDDGRIIISIGDVGGNGLNAAIIMVMIRQVIRGVAYIHPDPVMILDAAGKTLLAEYPNAYVSAFVGLIDPVEMTLTYASAGHLPPLLRDPDGSVRELTYDGVLLGVGTPERHPPTRITLQPGTLLVLYTDGLIEADENITASESRLRAGVGHHHIMSKKNIAHALHDAVLTRQARDDVAILTVSISASVTQNISHWTFDSANAEEAQHARKEFADMLRTQENASDEDIYAAELVFGELVGNVLRHTHGVADIIVDWSKPAPILHVRDHGPGFFYAPRLPHDLWAESGRGLYIIAKLTDDFNVTRTEELGSHARAVISLTRRRLIPTHEIHPAL